MLRPCSADARRLTETLRAEIARDLPLQLELMQSGRELDLDPELVDSLTADLPPPAPLRDADVTAGVRGYALGPRTFESVAVQVSEFVERRREQLSELDDVEAVGDLLPDGMSIPAAMRALRRAIRALAENLSGEF